VSCQLLQCITRTCSVMPQQHAAETAHSHRRLHKLHVTTLCAVWRSRSMLYVHLASVMVAICPAFARRSATDHSTKYSMLCTQHSQEARPNATWLRNRCQ
jgi:hypothetical protein